MKIILCLVMLSLPSAQAASERDSQKGSPDRRGAESPTLSPYQRAVDACNKQHEDAPTQRQICLRQASDLRDRPEPRNLSGPAPTPKPVAGPAPAPVPVPASPPVSAPQPRVQKEKEEVGGGKTIADDWKAEKINGALLDDALPKESPAVAQADAFRVQSNLMYDCVETSLSGRKDELCSADPGNPECVGFYQALANATSCKEQFSPASAGCKTFGTSEYTMDEWIAFAAHYENTMRGCATTKAKSDALDGNMSSLTDMARSGVALSAGEITMDETTSNVSVTKSEVWDELAEKFEDGGSLLGYQDGDIFRSAAKGESFFDIVTNSPFAEKLNVPNRTSLEEGIKNSEAVVQRVKGVRELEQTSVAARSTSGVPAGTPANAGAPGSSLPSTPALSNAPTTTLASATTVEPPRKMTQAERIAALAEEARQVRARGGRFLASKSPANGSEAQNATPANTDVSLFLRIRTTYKKMGERLHSLESSTGRAVRSLEKPSFFREL